MSQEEDTRLPSLEVKGLAFVVLSYISRSIQLDHFQYGVWYRLQPYR
jgi:hypothetical protein